MKYFQQTVNFDYSWEEVSTSNWQKYGPWNEKTPHVIAVDTLSRAVDPDTGIVSLFPFTCSQRARAPNFHQPPNPAHLHIHTPITSKKNPLLIQPSAPHRASHHLQAKHP